MNDETIRRSTAELETPADSRVTITAMITNRRGLHARAAAKFVKLAGGFDADVQVGKDGQSVSGLSIMGLMMLAAGPGSAVELSATGRQAEGALSALNRLILDKFEED